jgi:hypothetical protein
VEDGEGGRLPVNDCDEGCDQRRCGGGSGYVGEDALGKTLGVPSRRRSGQRRRA